MISAGKVISMQASVATVPYNCDRNDMMSLGLRSTLATTKNHLKRWAHNVVNE
jgi:hypothetical protein